MNIICPGLLHACANEAVRDIPAPEMVAALLQKLIAGHHEPDAEITREGGRGYLGHDRRLARAGGELEAHATAGAQGLAQGRHGVGLVVTEQNGPRLVQDSEDSILHFAPCLPINRLLAGTIPERIGAQCYIASIALILYQLIPFVSDSFYSFLFSGFSHSITASNPASRSSSQCT